MPNILYMNVIFVLFITYMIKYVYLEYIKIIYEIVIIPNTFFNTFFSFLLPYLWHMEISRLKAESELHLLVYATVTKMLDPRCIET